MRGKFIVVEGVDYSGKSSAINELRNMLGHNSKFVFTREPGGYENLLSESIRELIFNAEDIDPITETYLFAASRASHTKQIKQWIEDGFNVVCDRYLYSSLYYQGVINNIGPDKVMDINRHALRELVPDAVVFFIVSQEERHKREQLRNDRNRLDDYMNILDYMLSISSYMNCIGSHIDDINKLKIIDTTNLTAKEAGEQLLTIINELN